MNRKTLVPLIFLGLSYSCYALTDAGRKAAEELISSLQEEVKVKEGSDPNNNSGYPVKEFIRQLQSVIAKDNDSYIVQTLDSAGNSLKSEKSIASVAKFREIIQTEREYQSQATIERLEGLMKTTREKILAAREPSELDALIEDLTKNQSLKNDQSEGSNAGSQKTIYSLVWGLSSAEEFTIKWQDYLQAKKSGNVSQAVSALQSLSRNHSSLIPRSQILERIEQEKGPSSDITKIVEGIASLDDMQEAIMALIAAKKFAQSSDENYQPTSDLLQSLGRLEKAYREYRAGLPFNIEVLNQTYDSTTNTGNTKLVELRAELLKLVLPRYLSLPEGTAAKPGESILQFMDRLLAGAKESGDIMLCKRIVDLQTNLRINRISNSDIAGLKEYNAAQNQLAAGQHFLAVGSLQRALNSGSDLLPTERIGQQLAALKKDHPKEYEQGMTEYLTPRQSYEFPGGMPFRGYDPRMGYPNGDPRQQTGPSVLLPVPAKESVTTPDKAVSPKRPREK